MIARAMRRGAVAVAMLAAAAALASAQPASNNARNTDKNTDKNAEKSAPSAFQGFSQNRGEPVQIEAAHLEVRDKQKIATFSGGVKVVQGDTTMRCKSLVVFYEQSAQDSQGGQDNKTAQASAAKTAQPGPGGSSQIKKIEMHGGVTVVQKDQTASGDTGLFDMKTNTVTLRGNVVVSQGQNILRGDRMIVDMTTGVSHVESGKGPVRMLFQNQSQTPGAAPGGSPRKFGPQRPSSGSN
jgi:lipopolysaccharide export system protein LptA